MSYIDDRVFQVIQKIRTSSSLEEVISQAWRNWSGNQLQGVEINPLLINYKPFERARIVAEATIFLEDAVEPIKLNLFFHIFANPNVARQEAETIEKGDLFPCQGPPVFLVPDWQTVVWTLPNAPNLTELAQLLQPEKFAQLLLPSADLQSGTEKLSAPKLIRYVPLKRAILTWEHPRTRRRYFAKLFGDQILYSADGIGIVDWDALSLGDPLYDIGRLLAHLLYLAGREGIPPTRVSACAEALLRAYEEDTAQLVERKCLTWHVASQLLLRGKISSLRKLPEGWPAHLAFVVAESERLLHGQSQYLSLPAIARQVFCEV